MFKKLILILLLSTFSFGMCGYVIKEHRKQIALMSYVLEDNNDTIARLFYQEFLFWNTQVIVECEDYPYMIEFAKEAREAMKKIFKDIK